MTKAEKTSLENLFQTAARAIKTKERAEKRIDKMQEKIIAHLKSLLSNPQEVTSSDVEALTKRAISEQASYDEREMFYSSNENIIQKIDSSRAVAAIKVIKSQPLNKASYGIIKAIAETHQSLHADCVNIVENIIGKSEMLWGDNESVVVRVLNIVTDTRESAALISPNLAKAIVRRCDESRCTYPPLFGELAAKIAVVREDLSPQLSNWIGAIAVIKAKRSENYCSSDKKHMNMQQAIRSLVVDKAKASQPLDEILLRRQIKIGCYFGICESDQHNAWGEVRETFIKIFETYPEHIKPTVDYVMQHYDPTRPNKAHGVVPIQFIGLVANSFPDHFTQKMMNYVETSYNENSHWKTKELLEYIKDNKICVVKPAVADKAAARSNNELVV